MPYSITCSAKLNDHNVSNSFDKSKNTQMGVSPWSRYCITLSISSRAARSVELVSLNYFAHDKTYLVN